MVFVKQVMARVRRLGESGELSKEYVYLAIREHPNAGEVAVLEVEIDLFLS
jgi:hypothetical protein